MLHYTSMLEGFSPGQMINHINTSNSSPSKAIINY